jgi:hypothetical protein
VSFTLPIQSSAVFPTGGEPVVLAPPGLVSVTPAILVEALDLGTLAQQDADAVAITGGTIAGVDGLVGTHYQLFATSGTWTKPAGIRWVYVRGWGGGGGGFGGGSGYGGGGGGGYADMLLLASGLGATVAVTIGGVGVSGTSPTAGGSSSFGAHLVAPGGMAGSQYFSGFGGGVYLGSFGDPPHPPQGGYGAGSGGFGSSGNPRNGAGSIMGGAGGAASGSSGGNGGVSSYGGRGADASNNATAPGGGGWGNSGTTNHKNGALGRIQVWGW